MRPPEFRPSDTVSPLLSPVRRRVHAVLIVVAVLTTIVLAAADVPDWHGLAALLLAAGAGMLAGRLRRRGGAAGPASELRFRTYFDQVTDGILMLRIEPDGGFVYEEVNQAAEVILGQPGSAIIGRRPADVWPPERAAFIEARMRQCITEECPITDAGAVDLPEGKRKLCMTLALVRENAGRVQRLIQGVSDITERSHLEEQLRHSQRMEAIGRLTAGVAHDFNNLLQAQMGSLELLLDEVNSPAAREYAELTMRSAERGAQLTHHLLAFARKQVLQPKAVKLPPLLSELADVLRRTIGPHIDIEVDCAADLPAAYADPGQIEVALVNLALNARDAMQAGGHLRIAARLAREHAPGVPAGLPEGAYVVLAVADDGTGMAEDILAHACEPFFTTKGVNGSGLGLSMVQGFARQSGGDVTIASAPGDGTRIEIWLPRAAMEAPASAAVPAARLQGSGRVLLVDDAPDVLLTTGAFLQGAGFEVVRAASGDHALVVLAAGERFDALVTDYAMPALNGADLIVKALQLQPSLPALIITGFAEITGIEHLPGQIQILRKPFRREDLVRRVNRLMTTQKTRYAVQN